MGNDVKRSLVLKWTIILISIGISRAKKHRNPRPLRVVATTHGEREMYMT